MKTEILRFSTKKIHRKKCRYPVYRYYDIYGCI